VLSQKLAEGTSELEPMVTRSLAMLLDDVGRRWVEDGRVDAKKVVALPIAGQPVIG
jgi:hypothetical protein